MHPWHMALGTPGGPVELEVVGVEHGYSEGLVLRGVDISAAAGSTLVLLGPSGCGKTTLLRLIAGLDRPSAGVVKLGGEVVASSTKFVPPERRHVGLVFQDGALFPHLTVAKNVAFGVGRDGASRELAARALELVGLAELAHRMPSELSGGQRQRVAVARAIAPQPGVLLLDEPFASLDASLRVELRTQVHRLLRELEITSVFVTHDQDEAFVLGDAVAIMRDGAILQVGSPAEVYGHPANSWVARFVGDANLVPGHSEQGGARTRLGVVPVASEVVGPVEVLVRPEHLTLSAGEGGIVRDVEFYGHDTVYLVGYGDDDIKARVGAAPAHRIGDAVRLDYVGPVTVAFPAD
jgi:iron(III) transport system ATP-binding protein